MLPGTLKPVCDRQGNASVRCMAHVHAKTGLTEPVRRHAVSGAFTAQDELAPVAGFAESGSHGHPSVPARNGVPGSAGASSC